MKVFKKTIALGLCAVTAVSMLAGCGEEESNITKFEVWSHNSHSKKVQTAMIDEWNKTKGKELNIEIVYSVKEKDIQQAVEMAFESNQEPDMFSSPLIEKNAVAGNIVAFDDIEGGPEFLAKYDPSDYSGPRFQYDGKTYSLPTNVNTFGMVYNKDMFRKYGIVDENGEPTPPKTFKEVREYAKRMTNPAEQDYGIVLPMKWSAFYSVDIGQLVQSSAGRLAFDCRTGEYDFSVLKPIYEMYLGMKADGSIFPGSESLDNDTARAYFSERNIGMKLAGSYDVGVFNSQFPAKCDWGVAPYPVEDENKRYKYHLGTGGTYAISSSAREKVSDDVLMQIVELFYGEENAKTFYKEGMSINFNSSVIEGVTPKEGLKGWEEFAALASESTAPYRGASVEITGELGAQDLFMQEVWSGKITVDEAIEILNERYNRGMKTYYKNNPDKDFESLLNPDWDISVK